jgi:lysophospholipase L1-like esterase
MVLSLMKAKIALLSALLFALNIHAAPSHWVATWGASPSPQLPDEKQITAAKLIYDNQTLREIVHTSVGGDTFRIRLSNAYGKESADIGAVHIALRSEGASIAAGSDRAVTFSGRPAVSIPADAIVLSDPIKLTSPDGADLAISIFLPHQTTGAGIHYGAQQTNYIGTGDLAGAAAITEPAKVASWVFLSGVDVLVPANTLTIAAFGDSITDGARSTADTNHRWPDILSARLQGRHRAVLNAGIGGNRILHDGLTNVRFGTNALARFDRDVLSQTGIGYVAVLEGINDLGHAGTSAPVSETVSSDDVIAGLTQLIERAHEKGIKIIGCTILPFEGAAYFSAEREVKRKAINEWIRNGKKFDGVIDFDKAARDPSHPDRILAAYDSGDHLHPGDAGYKAMGDAIDLALFK